jgi:hypothetical protein
MTSPQDDLEKTKRLMGALVRQPPKPHEAMKIGKRKAKPSKSAARQKRRGTQDAP